MQKKTKKTPVKQKKKAQSPKKKNDQPFSLKRLIMGEEKRSEERRVGKEC